MAETDAISDVILELRSERERLVRHIELWRERVIGLLDSYEAALAQPGLDEGYRRAFAKCRRDLLRAVQPLGLDVIEPKPGDPFDEEFHRIVGEHTGPGVDPSRVHSLQRSGYRIGSEILRHADVITGFEGGKEDAIPEAPVLREALAKLKVAVQQSDADACKEAEDGLLDLFTRIEKKPAAKASAEAAAKAAATKKPSKNGRGRPPKMIKAFGTEKSLRDWAQDWRCKVTVATLRARLRAGMAPEEAISSPPYQAPGNRNSILVTAFGESKSIRRWSQDKRCKVSYYTLVQRIRTGMDPEMAITAPVTKGFYNKVLFGQKAREKSPNYTPHWVMREDR
jgi:hypothetical protein